MHHFSTKSQHMADTPGKNKMILQICGYLKKKHLEWSQKLAQLTSYSIQSSEFCKFSVENITNGIEMELKS